MPNRFPMRALPRSRIAACGAAILACALLAGCGSSPDDAAPVAGYQPRDPASEIERVPARRLERAPELPPFPVTIAVRAAAGPDLGPVDRSREKTVEEKRTLEGAGAIATALAAAAPPLYAGTIALGSLLVPAATGLELYERRYQNTIVRTLQEVDLPGQVRSALVRRAVPPSGEAVPTGVSLTLRTFGLAPRSGTCANCAICIVADAELVVTQDGTELLRDPLLLTPWRRSSDAPPPLCATMKEFADNDGRRLRDAILETAQVLAAMTVHRLPAAAWAE